MLSFIGLGERKAPWIDFTIITLCDHHIMGIGSFSLTSAFLGKGTIAFDPSHDYTNPRVGRQDPSIYIPIHHVKTQE